MIDIRLLRENIDVVRDSIRKRGGDPSLADETLSLDIRWRELQRELDSLRHRRNVLSVEIGKMFREGRREEAERLKEEVRALNSRIEDVERETERVKHERDLMLRRIPNIVHPDVPVGEGEEDNVPVRFWGKARVQKPHLEDFLAATGGKMDYEVIPHALKSHVDLLPAMDLADFERAAKVAGARFYYLKRDMVILEMALERFALDLLVERGYIPVKPPLMIRRKPMEGVTDFATFEEMIYGVEGEDLYLIATAEHPLAAMYMGEILEEKDLPIKFAGISPCFRKEAGAHGRDTKGIFRVHNFDKVEQFAVARPEDSWSILDEFVENAEEIYRRLELPYRVVEICSGELGAVAARKYDIEVWMPVQGKFREVVSATNATDYQARRLMIRYRTPEGFVPVHTVNATAVATTRTMVAIVENFQDEEGTIHIPRALRPYTGFDAIRPGGD